MQINKMNVIPTIETKKQPAFGSMAGLGKKLLSCKKFKKLAMDPYEYANFSMSMPTMMLVLYGATIPPRYIQAVDKHDRREILTRDVASITAILFFSTALSRAFSKIFSKITGFALNNRPLGHKNANIFKKAWNYLTPFKDEGIDVLNSHELTLKYSNFSKYKNGIHDFFTFIKKQGGNVGKVLSWNKTVKENADKILGKSVKKASFDEIDNAFKKAEGSDALKNIYKAFEKADNKYVRSARTMNSTFTFLSLVLLVPGFMIWLEKFNEKTTKRLIAKEQAEKAAAMQKEQNIENETIKTA